MELLVVIAIIAILATILLLQLGTARAKSRDTKRIADITQVRTAIEQYFDDNSHYPVNNTQTEMDKLAPYLTKVPQDPLASACTGYTGTSATSRCYGYAYGSATQYQVWAELEKKSTGLNSDADINSSLWSGGGGAKIDGGPLKETCNPATIPSCIFDLGQNQ
ncbi:MAG: Uncharacterized protein CEN90_252 [Parcubacteria group bacterium Licking1014_17]|nr:MAG: Uncharacterized protein CEN90_252 [Parcubacteria group bacterium Licking1014_17]